MQANSSWNEIYEQIYAEEIAINNLTKFLTILIFAVLVSFFLIFFVTSIALDRKKLETTGEIFRIVKRCISWVLVVIASALFYVTLIAIPVRNVFIYTAVASAISLLVAITLPFFNTHYIILSAPPKKSPQNKRTNKKT